MAIIDGFEVTYRSEKTKKKGRPKTIICIDGVDYTELGFDKKLRAWYWTVRILTNGCSKFTIIAERIFVEGNWLIYQTNPVSLTLS